MMEQTKNAQPSSSRESPAESAKLAGIAGTLSDAGQQGQTITLTQDDLSLLLRFQAAVGASVLKSHKSTCVCALCMAATGDLYALYLTIQSFGLFDSATADSG